MHFFEEVFMCYLIFSVSKTSLKIWENPACTASLAPRFGDVGLWDCITFKTSETNK